MKTINKFIVTAAVVGCMSTPAFAYYDFIVPTPSDNPIQDYTVAGKGEYVVDGMFSTGDLTNDEVKTIYQATQNWNNIIDTSKHKDTNGVVGDPTVNSAHYFVMRYNEPNDGCGSFYVTVNGENYTKTAINAVINGKDYIITDNSQKQLLNLFRRNYPALMLVGVPLGTIVDPAAQNNFDTTNYALWQDYDISFLVVIQHEVAHSLGIMNQKEHVGQDWYFSKDSSSPISIWNSYMRVGNPNDTTNPVVEPYRGMRVYIDSSKTKQAGDFDIVNNSPYFVGDETMKVLGGSDDLTEATKNVNAKGLMNYSTNKIVYGLPIHPIDRITDGPDLQHIELRNSYMSHQMYRNYTCFMEAELAALKDIGYTINLKDYFGKSFYLDDNGIIKSDDGTIVENPVYLSDFYRSYSSDKDHAIGTHIYSDNNIIVQDANINTTGDGSFGARIDGVENTYTISKVTGATENTKITVNGNNSIGVGVTYGKDHIINLQNGAEITTTGENSPAVSFDFGKNVLGEVVESRGSYTRTSFTQNQTPLSELQGALVNEFNISNGSKISADTSKNSAAIYISENAHVANINIGDNSSTTKAVINGDIVSEWNSVVGGKYGRIQYNSGTETNPNWEIIAPDDDTNKHYTNININSDFSYGGNIQGDTTYSIVNYDETGTYIGNTLILNIIKDTKNNIDGKLTVNNNARYNVYAINNDGELNIAKSTTLYLSTLNGNITGNGTINVKSSPSEETISSLVLASNVKNIENTINLEDYAVLSTLNKEVTTHTINTLNLSDKSYLAFDLGDSFNITNSNANIGKIAYIYVPTDEVESLVKGDKFTLFDKTKTVLNLNGSSTNFYYGGNKYTISQDGSDKSSIIAKNTSETGITYGLCDATGDNATLNYIVANGEKQTKDAGIITADKPEFEILGSDLDFDNHKGLTISGNKNTVIQTSVYGASHTSDTITGYTGADLTVKNAGNLTIDSTDKEINIGSTDKDAINVSGGSTVTLNSNENAVNILGNIVGDGTTSTLITSGDTVNIFKIDPITVETNATNTTLNGISDQVAWNLNAGVLSVANDAYLSSHDNTITFNGGMLNLMNNQTSEIGLSGMELNSTGKVGLDIDLNSLQSDQFTFNNDSDLITNDNTLNISNINIMNPKTILTNDNYSIPFVSSDLHNTNLIGHVESVSQEIMTPILKYNLTYSENENNEGMFALNRTTYGGSNDYNPAVLAGPIAAQLGGYMMQTEIYSQAFANMDMTMLMTKEQRQAMKMANKYASTEGELTTFSPNQIPEQSRGMYFRPFASYGKVGLVGGPRVESTMYGTLVGGESDLIELKNGWDMNWGAYVGYLGSHQSYTDTSIYQNGGTFGLNAAWYKGNFFTGLTANVGASVAEMNTMYGNETMSMLMTGIASKTGYNFEFAKGRFIIQPSWIMSYTMIDAFNYNNAANVAISSQALHAIQLAPALKFIGNLDNGWQPYAAIQMIWNIMDNTRFAANNIDLPNMSVSPYFQYGVGLQKRWGDRFTGYGQVMLRNGGVNGIAFNTGFRWALGKDSKKLDTNTSKVPKLEKTKVSLSSLK